MVFYAVGRTVIALLLCMVSLLICNRAHYERFLPRRSVAMSARAVFLFHLMRQRERGVAFVFGQKPA